MPRQVRVHTRYDGRRRGHHLTDTALPRKLEQRLSASDIDLVVGRRVLNRRSNARLRRQVDNRVHIARESTQRSGIADIARYHAAPWMFTLRLRVSVLRRRAVERIEVIERRDPAAVAEQSLHDVAANETRAAGYEDMHARNVASNSSAKKSSMMSRSCATDSALFTRTRRCEPPSRPFEYHDIRARSLLMTHRWCEGARVRGCAGAGAGCDGAKCPKPSGSCVR